jgi:hypothetical protein
MIFKVLHQFEELVMDRKPKPFYARRLDRLHYIFPEKMQRAILNS